MVAQAKVFSRHGSLLLGWGNIGPVAGAVQRSMPDCLNEPSARRGASNNRPAKATGRSRQALLQRSWAARALGRLHQPIAGGAPQCDDAGFAVAGRVHPVGQQRPGQPALEIDPQPRSGEARMADGRLRSIGSPPDQPSCLASHPTVRVADSRVAGRRDSAGTARSPRSSEPRNRARRRSCRTDRHGPRRRRAQRRSRHAPRRASPDRARCSARSPRRRRVGPEAEARRNRLVAQRSTRQPFDRDSQQHEIDVGIDRRPARQTRCRMKARKVSGSCP